MLFYASGGHLYALAQGLFPYLQSQQRLSTLSHSTFPLTLSIVTSPSHGLFTVFLFHVQEPFWLYRILVIIQNVCVHAHERVLSRVCLFVTPWAAVCQTLLSMEFFRQEYWSQLLFLTPGDLPDPGIKPVSLIFFTAGRFFYHQRHLEIPMFLPPTKSAPKSEFH